MSPHTPYFYLAPLRGITDALFREVFTNHFCGFNCAMAPFINPQSKSQFADKMLSDVLPENNSNLEIVPQLLHTSPEPFLALAQRLTDLGYSHLNWNLGCPAPMVAKKKRGSGLLPYPDEILKFLDTVIPLLDIKLSIKTRLGFHNSDELITLLPHLDNYPLKEIIIHARLGKQLYKGDTDPDGFSRCLQLTNHTFVYNGDIVDIASFKRLSEMFPTINRWMIGRGALANPLLAEQLKQLTNEDKVLQLDRLYRFHLELFSEYEKKLSGPGHLLGRLKLIWTYLIHSFPVDKKYFKQIQKSRSPVKYLQAVQDLFENASYQ